jgi:hypothetical protein
MQNICSIFIRKILDNPNECSYNDEENERMFEAEASSDIDYV